jgi:hypothetical protein
MRKKKKSLIVAKTSHYFHTIYYFHIFIETIVNMLLSYVH